MEFINREKEMEFLKESKKFSRNKIFTLNLYGLRRIGKTRLLLEFLKDEDLYFFVNKDKSSFALLKEFEETIREVDLLSEFEELKTWDDFFKILFTRFRGVVVFDEFQNFEFVDKSVFGILQKMLDIYENEKNLLIIFCGSIIGMIKKVFSKKEPLYGRIKKSLKLPPLSFRDTYLFCKKLSLDIETCVSLYSIFGGFPRYYVAIEDEMLEGKKFPVIIEKFFFSEPAVFEDEINVILSIEFGKRKGMYYDILSAVASGRRRISEIASFLSVKQTSITRHISELLKNFEYLEYETQVIGNKRLLKITHPLIEFWMKFFHPNLSLYIKRDSGFIRKVKNNINAHVGRKFENIVLELLEKKLVLKEFKFTKIGKQWGHISGKPKGENIYEIDVVALNEKTKEILFGECKWQSGVSAKKICKELVEKSEYVDWNRNKREEYLAVFAKSFSKKIDEFEGRKVYCFDLENLEESILELGAK